MDYHIKNGETNPILELFDYFVNAGTCKTILHTFQRLCNALDIKRTDHRHFYKLLKSKLTSWKAQSLWAKLDKRASHKEYRKGEACANTRVLIIGSGPCGLRIAIETALLGGKVVVVEKRDRFSRNNVLHLWPFLITDLKNLGAKKFFGKFCAGSIEHISVGWKCLVCPKDHPVSEFVFDVLIGADGKRNTLSGFKRKEFRGKLAIAITANFINFNTQEEAQAEEISGVAFIYNQKFFHELREKTRIDLENIVYYKDETHYFVMTAKKTSLLEKGVLKHDFSDTGKLLSHENVDQEALLNYAKEAADFSTNYKLPTHEYAVNHYGRADVAMFDFTSLFQAENASRVLERHQHRLLLGLVGDTLLEPFWPTGSGCARGFLGAFDAAWMIRRWASGSMTPLQVIAERESIYRLLSQTTPENLKKNFNMYTINPNTRYPDLNLKYFRPDQVRHLYDCGEETFIDEIIEIPAKKARNDDLIDSYTLLCWCQSLLNEGKHKNVNVVDFTFSWKSGLALCALISVFRPDLFDFSTLNEEDFVYNNQLAFGMAEKELGILPVMTGKEMAECEVPDKLTMISYLSQFFEILKKEKPAYSNSLIIPLEEVPKSPLRSPAHRISLLQKFSHRFSKTRRKSKDEEENIQKRRFFGAKRTLDSESQKPVELTHFKKLPITEISNKLTTDYKVEDIKREKKEVQSNINVSAMAELLANKFKSGFQTPEPPVKRLISTPSLLAAQPASEFCYFCKKRVYIMERMSAEGLFFHRGCLRCDYCKRNLRLGNYAFEKNSPDTAKFYCFRHVGMMKRPRKRGYAEDDDVVKESIEASHQVAESSLVVPPFKQEQEQPVPLPSVGKKILTNVKIPQEIFATAQNTPERIEFENSIAGLTEESEEQQTQHNLQSYLSMETIFLGSDEDDDDDDSDSDDDDYYELSVERVLSQCDDYYELDMEQVLSQWSSDEDADDEDADNDTDGEMTWEDVCRIAKSWTRKSLLEQVHSESSSLDENGMALDDEEGLETEKEFSSEEVDDIFIVHTPSESEDRPITDVSRVADKQFPARTGTLSPPVLPAPPLRSPLSPSSVMAARANFFASPPEPVRLDAKLVFGMDNTHKLENSDKEQERKDDATAIMISDQIHGSRQRLPSAPETEVLDSVKTTKVVSVEEDEDKENLTKDELIESDTETLEDEQSEDLEFDEQEKANNMEKDDEEFDRLAVSQAMERFLGDIISKSDSESDEKIRSRSDAFHQTKEKPFSDSETASTISTESLDTEMAVLQSVAEMVYSDIESNDETLQEVLDSIKATNDMLPDASESTDQNEDKQPWTGIDDRFVTRRKQGTTSFENSFASLDLLSDESFITSEISTSSSLSEAVQYNEQFFQQDENKTDLLKEYEHALREVVNMQLDSQETKDLHLASFTEKDNLTPKRISSGKEEVVCETAVKKENKNLYTTLKNNLDLNCSCKDETHFLKSSSTGVAAGSKGKSSAPLTSLNFPSTVKSLATNSEECGQQRVKTDGVPAEQLKLHPFPRPRRMLPEVKDFRKNLLLPRASHPIPTPRLSKSSNDQPASPKMGLLVNKTIKDKELKENNLGQTPGVEKIRIPVCNLNIKLDSHIESDKMSSPEVASRKKIPLDVSLLKHEKNPSVGNSVENDIDDIPFADESDSDAFFPSEKFYTQAISVNYNATGSQTHGFRKRILPSIPQTVRSPALPSPDQIQSMQAVEKEKTRLKLTEDAIRVMNQVSDIPANLTVCGWVTERPPASKAGSLKEKSQMFQESHCVLGEPEPPTKKEKKRSLLSMFLPGRSWHKTASSGTGSEKLKLPPTRKENKSSKIGQKDKRQMNSVDGLEQDICDDMKDLNIQSVFYSPYPKPEEDETFSKAGYQFIPPQADLDDFSDSGESFLSTDTTLSKRSRSDPKRIQRAARKQQKRRQQQRLRKAQEIQRHLEEVDVKQKELEERGVLVEKSLRGEGADARRSESELMQEWFNLVHEKNVLVRCESELMVQAKELELEDRQARLEQELREKKNHEEPNESGSQISDDANILKELLEVVEQRNALVAMLDDDRLREQEEDKNLESVMHIKGFQLTSLTS